MQLLCEKNLDFNDIFICFVDCEKAFDRVNWVKLMEILKTIGVNWRDRRSIINLYMAQDGVIRVADGDSEPELTGRVVRQ